MKYGITTLIISLFTLTSGLAASFSPPVSAGSLFEASGLNRISLGIDYERIQRDVVCDCGAASTLQSKNRQAHLGVDVTPWLQVYGIYGITEAGVQYYGYEEKDDKWALGLSATLWNLEVESPRFMSGRYFVQVMGEYGDQGVENAQESGSWTEWSGSLIAGAELFAGDRNNVYKNVPHSLVLYVGGVYSRVDGDVMIGGVTTDFEEDKAEGLLLGADLFIARNLSIGVQSIQIEHNSHRLGLRYHFR